MKGFWNREENRWAYENYTDMYNLVYLRVKEVNPAAKIGGPYTKVPRLGIPNAQTRVIQT